MIHRIQHHVQRHYHRVKHHLKNAFIPHEGNDHRPHALRHKALTAYAVVIVLVKVIVSGVLFFYPGPSITANLTPNNIINLTNEARLDKNLKSLRQNAKLSSAAQLKAQDMLAKGYFAHVSPQKVTPWYWFKQAGYNYRSAGENLAMDFVTAEDVTAAWLASPSHRRNMLNSKYADIGVAVASGKIQGASSTIVVQFFGAPVATKQQPKPVAKVTPTKPTSPTKPSSVAVKSQPTSSPVLGEETPPLPATPKLTSPADAPVLATAQPWFGGESEPKVTIFLFLDARRVGETVSDEKGYFRLQPTEALPDGEHRMTAATKNVAGTSQPSEPLTVTIDTQPPSTSLASAAILPSFVTPGAYTIFGTIAGEDIAGARVRIGSSATTLANPQGTFVSELMPNRGDGAVNIEVVLQDAVGNVSVVPAASLSFLDLDIVQPEQKGFLSFLPKIIFFSQRFFITFWLFIFLALAINVLVKIRVQHRPMILYSLLLLYGLTVIMMTT